MFWMKETNAAPDSPAVESSFPKEEPAPEFFFQDEQRRVRLPCKTNNSKNQEVSSKPIEEDDQSGFVELELPDWKALVDEIIQLSPLARQQCTASSSPPTASPSAAAETASTTTETETEVSSIQWEVIQDSPTTIEPLSSSSFFTTNNNNNNDSSSTSLSTKIRICNISKVDNFRNRECPIVRFQAKIFLSKENIEEVQQDYGKQLVSYIMDFTQRHQWDDQVDRVEELYPVADLQSVQKNVNHSLQEMTNDTINVVVQKNNNQQNLKSISFGECARLGVGYYRSKSSPLVAAREQLTLCGIQEFGLQGEEDNVKEGQTSCGTMIWAIELPHRYDNLIQCKNSLHMLPPTVASKLQKNNQFTLR